MNLIGIVTAIIAFWPLGAPEKHIVYLAPHGLDSNPGTKEQPLASLTGARDAIRKLNTTDSVLVKIAPGDYFMNTPLELTERDATPVVFEGEGGQVTFYGGIPVKGWEKVSEQLWRAAIPAQFTASFPFEQLIVNGKRAVRASTGFFQVKTVSETVMDPGRGRMPEFAVQKISLNPEDAASLQKEGPENIQNAVISLYHKWDVTRKYIDHFDPDSSIVYIRGKGMQPWNQLDQLTQYKIENLPSALDSPGEWLVKKDGYVYYIPKEGEEIHSIEVFAPATDKFITIRGNKLNPVKHKTFKGIRFKVAGYRLPKQGNDPLQAAATEDASIMVDYADYIRFENCELAHTGLYGIWFRRQVTNSQIDQCYLHDLGAGGVKIGDFLYHEEDEDVSANNLVHNSIIRDGGQLFPSAVGVIVFHSRDNEITHNEIADFRYSGVSVGWMWGYESTKVVTNTPDKHGIPAWREDHFKSPATGNVIAYNHIHHLGWGELSDMGGVYILSEAFGTHVHYNVIHHIYSATYGGWGLYTDEGATHVTMENNLVYACKNSGFHQHYGKENHIRNNIFAFNLKGQVQFTRVEDHRSFDFTNNIVYTHSGDMLLGNLKDADVKMENNCYWDTRTKEPLFQKMSFREWKKLKDRNSLLADPGFVDAENFDFRLKSLHTARKIGFKPFDYSKAGVYGSEEWKQLAIMDSVRIDLFAKIVDAMEK
ncbi:MAG: right-handed parallel beta-helix repeat-containing protein [Lunatimonas sp.]|uniref:right-handed parallel beta-helix repeat-containing protein n=1 Tax=Lunatimonas sp. TaxID=2060141 RepID=UPI00263AE04A|nr:right-handed parallel beta-helix repeat-containing protein [Lunatimonas sp.]MCC5939300.1 right-handed parallel beta-helix repeat-containing protein [Lunatimonas sp.]